MLAHLAEQLRRVDGRIQTGDNLLATVRGASLPTYLVLTREALACADWYRRFVQSELGIEAGEDDDARD
jgi:CRISPR-associated protein Cmr5